MSHAGKSIGLAAAALAACTALSGGCLADFVANLTEERSGNVTVIIINNTPYRAAFSFGSYDALDRFPAGPVTLEQQRVERYTQTAPIRITCARNTAVGTEEFIQRSIDVDADDTPGFDPDAFNAVVNFSSAPADSDGAALPTVGTAEGLEVRLGVDYACEDQLVFTFVEDATATGGFRIDFSLLRTEGDE